MKKKLPVLANLLTAMCFALYCPVVVLAQDIEWGSYLTSNGRVWNGRCAIDSAGNIFSSGFVTGDTLIVATPASSDTLRLIRNGTANAPNGYLIKYRQDGSIAWGKRMESQVMNHLMDIAVDAMGNVYITGRMQGNSDFNPQGTGGTVSNFGLTDIYLAKYDKDGNFIWARGLGGDKADQGLRIGLDTMGNIYLMGTYQSNTLYLNPGNINGTLDKPAGTTRDNIFIAQYDTSGNYKWGFDIGNNTQTSQGGFVVSPSGDIIVSGQASGTFTIGSGNNTALITPGGFVAKYKTDGSFDWGYSTGNSRIRGINITHDNYILFTGVFTGATDMDYGSGTFMLVSQGGTDAFLSKYDSNGRCQGAANIVSGSMSCYAENIVTDRVGNIYVSGRFMGTVDFNSGLPQGIVTSSGRGFDLFIAKYKPDWQFEWVRTAKGAGTEDGSGLAISNSGSVILAGFYEEDTDGKVGQNINPYPDLLSSPPLSLQNSNAFVLQLTCNDTSSSFLSETLECGAPYTLNGKVYTAAGTHIQRIPNTAGCDSTITFELIYTELNPEIIADSFSLKTNEGYSSYQWLKNGEPIADATESRLYISQSGHYQVIVTNEYGCTDTSEVYAITFPLAIDETAAIRSAIKIYPNPTQDKLCIQSPISINIVLTGIDGRILTTEKNATILSLKGYAEGVYFIRITDAEGKLIKTDKVIKK